MRRVAVLLVDRANYGRLKPVMRELHTREDVELQVICAGTMLLERFGRAEEIVRSDGFDVVDRIYLEVEGSVPNTMAKSVGLAIIEFSNSLLRLKPDVLLLIGDRYEALAAATAAAIQNVCIVHVQGGEVSGSIDESTRHAITKLAHYHFPSTDRAASYIVRMGESADRVFNYGCPSADVVGAAMDQMPREELDKLGVGPSLDFSQPYLLALLHPVTTEFEAAEAQMGELLKALRVLDRQTILLWPNIDAGADGVSQAIRRYREANRDAPLHVYKNFEPESYIPILAHAACAIGNSSSFVRDASFLGTPVVLVGSRQDGREHSEAVVKVRTSCEEIVAATRAQVAHGRYPVSNLYGSTGASRLIAEQVAALKPFTQKTLDYVLRDGT